MNAFRASAVCALIVAMGCAHVEPEPPPKTISWKDTALYGTPARPGVATVEGSLDKEIIRTVIGRHLAQVRACYLAALRRTPALEGKIVVEFAIAGTGRVERAIARQSTTSDEKFEACVVNEVMTWRFPEPQGGGKVDVTYPFVFKTEADEGEALPDKALVKASENADVDAIVTSMREYAGSVRDCYERGLERNGKLEGTVELDFAVDATGKVAKAKILKSTLGDPRVERCIVEEARTWLFPKPQGGAMSFRYPFIFQAAKSSIRKIP